MLFQENFCPEEVLSSSVPDAQPLTRLPTAKLVFSILLTQSRILCAFKLPHPIAKWRRGPKGPVQHDPGPAPAALPGLLHSLTWAEQGCPLQQQVPRVTHMGPLSAKAWALLTQGWQGLWAHPAMRALPSEHQDSGSPSTHLCL